MSHGRHVAPAECERIRDLRRRGYARDVIGYALLDERLAPDSVGYHALGHCAHGGEPVDPEPPGQNLPDVPAIEDS